MPCCSWFLPCGQVNRAGAFFISCIVLNFITVPAGFLSIYSLDLYIKQQKINYWKRNPNRNFALRGFSQLTRHEWCCLQRKWKGKKTSENFLEQLIIAMLVTWFPVFLFCFLNMLCQSFQASHFWKHPVLLLYWMQWIMSWTVKFLRKYPKWQLKNYILSSFWNK